MIFLYKYLNYQSVWILNLIAYYSALEFRRRNTLVRKILMRVSCQVMPSMLVSQLYNALVMAPRGAAVAEPANITLVMAHDFLYGVVKAPPHSPDLIKSFLDH